MRVLFANFIYAFFLVLLMAIYALAPLQSEAHALVRAVLVQNGIYVLPALALVLAALERITGKSIWTRIQEALPAPARREESKQFVEINFS